MSDFDRQNEEVFSILHENHARQGVTRTVGYIVSQEQAERLSVLEARQDKGSNLGGMIVMGLTALAVIAAAVALLM